MKLTVSAPGKVFLMGEHSVVYGKPALLAAIDKRLNCVIESAPKMEVITDQKSDYLSYIINLFEKTYKKSVTCVKITINSNIPPGRHLGSSAALSVATIGALTRYFLKIWDLSKINKLSYEAEKKIHNNPSGADNTICCFGGLLWYRKEVEFLKSIWNLPISSYKIPEFILIDTGLPKENTGTMVDIVKKKYGQMRRAMKTVFNNQEEITKRVLVDLKTGNHEDLKIAIIAGERNLEKMGVVNQRSQKIIKNIEKIGGAAKISGGGGKSGPTGFLLAYHPQIDKLIKFAQNLHLSASPVKLGEEGIRLETYEK